MLHNTTPTTWFDGKSPGPQWVRVLVFNDQVHLYEATADHLLHSYPLSGCSVTENGGRQQVYLTANPNNYLVLDERNTISGLLISTLQAKQHSWFRRLIQPPIALFLCMLAVLGIAIYFLFTEAVPRIGLRFISISQEEQLGQSFFGAVVDTATIDRSASLLAQDFARHLHLSNSYRIKVYVVNQKTINAFALPGGIIVINSGLINKMSGYEELAALLGHEVTHINDRHSLDALFRRLSFTAFIAIVTGDMAGISGALLSNAAALQSLSYFRSLETFADYKGMQILVQNQVNPAGMVQLMQHLQAGETDGTVAFLSSHPLTVKRIQQANAFITLHNGATYTPHPELASLWTRLKALYF